MKIQGRATITEDEQKEALFELAKHKREILSLAVDQYLKSKGMEASSVQYKDGKVEAIIGGHGLPVKSTKRMASGWKREYRGLTKFLVKLLTNFRRNGQRKTRITTLLNEVESEFPQAKKKMEEGRLGGYLRDQRYFPGIKYNAVTGEIFL